MTCKIMTCRNKLKVANFCAIASRYVNSGSVRSGHQSRHVCGRAYDMVGCEVGLRQLPPCTCVMTVFCTSKKEGNRGRVSTPQHFVQTGIAQFQCTLLVLLSAAEYRHGDCAISGNSASVVDLVPRCRVHIAGLPLLSPEPMPAGAC